MAESPRAKRLRRTTEASEHLELASSGAEAAEELANDRAYNEAQTWALVSIAHSNAAQAVYTLYGTLQPPD